MSLERRMSLGLQKPSQVDRQQQLLTSVQATLDTGHRAVYALPCMAGSNRLGSVKVAAVVVNTESAANETAIFIYTGYPPTLGLEGTFPILKDVVVWTEEAGKSMLQDPGAEPDAPCSPQLYVVFLAIPAARKQLVLQALAVQQHDDLVAVLADAIWHAAQYNLSLSESCHVWLNGYKTDNPANVEPSTLAQWTEDQSDIDVRESLMPTADELIESEWIEKQMKERRGQYTDSVPLRVLCGTWNVNGRPCTEKLDDWLTIDNSQPADLVVIGLQEADLTARAFLLWETYREDEWEAAISQALKRGGNYTKIASRQLVGMLLYVYAESSKLTAVGEVESSVCGVGLMNRMGNKGGVAVRMYIHDTAVCIVNSHLAADVGSVERRNADFNEITRRLTFTPPLDHITDHEIVFWMGDLNYRLTDMDNTKARKLIGDNRLAELAAHDQLSKEMAKGLVFQNFQEGPLNFHPTYKFDVGTDTYDTSEKMRCPAWTDRILVCGKDNDIKQHYYQCCKSLMGSDHKPVRALFSAQVGVVNSERIRAVYEEVLKENDFIRNGAQPKAQLSTTTLDFETVHYMGTYQQTVEIANSGLVPVRWKFIPKLGETRVCKSPLTISPESGDVDAGQTATITFTMLVGPLSAARLGDGSMSLDDILILHLDGGRDFYITVECSLASTPIGASLEDLVSHDGPVRPDPQHNEASILAKANVPMEVVRLGEYIRQHCHEAPGLFQEVWNKNEVRDIVEALATGQSFDTSFSIHSYIECLLQLLRALPVPVFPAISRDRALLNHYNPETCKQVCSKLPLAHQSTCKYITDLANDIIRLVAQSSDAVDALAMALGDALLRTQRSRYPEIMKLSSDAKINVVKHLMLHTV